MTSNINLNLNQSPYFDDYDETKDFHQVLYKPAVAVQARELSQEQTILRNQVKRFGDHIFANGSRVSGGELHIDSEYEYVKLQATYNNAAITASLLSGKTLVGNTSGTSAKVVNYAAIDSVTGDPNTIWVKYLSGGAITDGVQGIVITNQGSGYSSAPLVTIADPPSGTTATATAVLSYDQKVIGVNITNVGSGYTSVPAVTIVGAAAGTATLTKGAVFSAGERITATDLSSSVLAALSSPTGKGSAVSNDSGYYYFNGNFIRAGASTLILDKYTNTPSYRIGFQVTASIIDSGDDSSLLDNAQGAYNYAAPGADRLKYALVLTKKTTASTDDTDFIEMIRLVNGVRHQETSYAIYSVLEETFARRTHDESGSYTVRHFPLQLKLSTDSSLTQAQNDARFVARLDPGKAYVHGHEFMTLISTDITVERARETNQVNGFDRLMQYGNYAIVRDLEGFFDTTGHAIVDLHKVAHESIIVTNPTTYANTKIGTAKIRQLNYVSGNTTTTDFKKYLYDINMSSSDFGDVQSIIIPTDSATTPVVVSAKSNIDNTGKVGGTTTAGVTSVVVTGAGVGYTSIPTVTFSGGGGTTQATGTAVLSGGSTGTLTSVTVNTPGAGYTSAPGIAFSTAGSSTAATAASIIGGDTKLFDTDFNTLVFKLAQNTVKTIRDSNNAVDTGYQIQRTFPNQLITAGQCVLTGGTETFFGTGALSDTIKLEHYHATARTQAGGSPAVGSIIDYRTASGGVITVASSQVTLNTGQAHTYRADIIATMNVDNSQEKSKTLVKNATKNITSPTNTALGYTSLDTSDLYAIRAIYDSGNTGNNATAPTLTLDAGATGTFIAGETITGGTSEAIGTVIAHSPATTVTFVVTSGTFVAAETITGGANSFTGVIASGGVAAGDTEISSRYILDNGQRDNFYDHGRIQLKSGSTAPTGRILVIMDYFTHSGTGYLSVDSYVSPNPTYTDIPSYTSPVSGEKVELRDCVDFRPRRADGGTAMQNIQLPYPNTNWEADYSYYLPRIDTVYIGKDKNFGVHTGVSADSPVPPYKLDNTMNLWQLKIPAYTFKPTDVVPVYLENKRYTMKDIARLERRLNNVEYYTALTMLEKDAEALVIPDANGLDRFKNGILVDDFAGHSVGNVFSEDYKCAVDFSKRELRAPFESYLANLSYQSGSSTGVQLTGDLITLPYTSSSFISQTQATSFTSVNPFDVQSWVGVVTLDPPSDSWVAKNNRPDVVINATGENDAWEQLAGLGWGSQWNDWQDIGTGRNERVTSREEARWEGRALMQEQTFAVDQLQSRQGIRTEIVGSETVQQSLGERVVDVSVLPFIRAQSITVNATGLKPNTRVYPFFDKEPIASYCTPSGGSAGGAIYSDSGGSVSGLVFNLPCPDFAQDQDPPLLVFRTGERQFLLTDDSNGSLSTATTFAESMFQAQGLLQTSEEVILSSRVPRLHVGGMGSADEAIVTTRRFDRDVVIGWAAAPDPLAQTFFVDPAIYPDGVYLSDVDLFFKAKDDGGVPIFISIRSTEAGFPTLRVVPFSDISKVPSEISISEDGSTATNWVFPSPVFLVPGEYALVVMSNSSKYECFFAELGQNIIGTTRKVSEQPYIGVLFKSQNASTWEQNQNQDLTFNINRCNYTTGATANAVFHNATGQSADADMDVMQLTPQEVKIDNTSINWTVNTAPKTTGTISSTAINTVPNKNHTFDTQQVITTTSGNFKATASLTSSNSHISPIIDTKRLGVIAVKNKINDDLTGEADSPSGGDALAKYISRQVTLTDGFDATDLSVFLTVNKPATTNVYVYYKVLSQYDPGTFNDRPWTSMSQTTNLNNIALNDTDFIEYQYDPSTTTTNYTASSVTYTSFKTFAIKIVMTSTNTTKVPRIEDLRTIALA